MRIHTKQLDQALKNKLLPVYLVTGDEPLLVQEALDSIRAASKQSGCDERKILDVDRKFDWASLNNEANSLSLFAERTLTELRLGKAKPGIPGGKALQQYCQSLPEDKILLISSAKLTAATLKSKWCAAIDKEGGIIQVWPIGLNEMPQWIAQRARKMGLEIEQEAIALLADRLEGNLLAAQQELEKLKLLGIGKKIDADTVLSSVSDSAKYDIFNLTDACLSGNAKLAVKIVSSLKIEGLEATYALWALTKEVRTVYALHHALQKNQQAHAVFKKLGVFQKRQPMLMQTAKRHKPASLRRLLNQCKQADDVIKGVEKGLGPWDVLLDIALGLAGSPVIKGVN
ncbi:MAG: DNA polymerase-3 subunit delta [Pseudohongiellaceae bacterium]|jgi:DNA polymerase-3 subunit delta